MDPKHLAQLLSLVRLTHTAAICQEDVRNIISE